MSEASRLTALLALAVALSGGMHAALVPEHLTEMPALGWCFTAAAITGTALAGALLLTPPRPGVVRLTLLFLAGEVLVWVVFVSLHVPGFDGTPEPVEPIALVCKGIELAGLVAGVLAERELRWMARSRRRVYRPAGPRSALRTGPS